MSEIKNLHLAHLRQEEAFGFHQLVIAETARCTDAKLTPLQTAYTTALNNFDQALKTGGTNPLSEQITALDAKRDEAYAGLVAQIRNFLRHFDPAKVATAKEADLIIRKYGNPCTLPYVEENGVLHNLIQELEIFDNPEGDDRPDIVSLDAPATNRLASINAFDWLEHLKTVNQQFLALFTDRNTAQATIVTGASKATRTLADEAYRALAKRINALAEVNGEADYIDVINAVNSLIDRQQSVLSARKTTNARKSGSDRPVIV